MNFKALAAAGAIAAFAPLSAQAVLLELDANGTTTTLGSIGGGDEMFSGTLDDFVINLAFASNAGGGANQRELNTQSFQSSGVGTLVITATEEYDMPLDPGTLFGITGTGSVANIGDTVTIEHFISLNGAPFVQIGDDLFFGLADAAGQETSGVFAAANPFQLKTIVTIVNDSSDETSNVNATLTATVPLPAPLAFLLTGIAGLGYMSRRKAA